MSAFSDDEVIRLRKWGTDWVCVFPDPPIHPCYVGASTECNLQTSDAGISLRHAELIHGHGQWRIRDLESTTGLQQDGEARREFVLTPGVEVGIGATTWIAESRRSIALREFCARILGWGNDRLQPIDHALRALRLAAAQRAPLVIRGEEDLVAMARALHRRVLGPAAPFVVCDHRREDLPASIRSPTNQGSGVAAFRMAAGGSLCLWSSRLPRDLPELLSLRQEPDHRVQLIVCTSRHARDALLIGPMPIEIPPLGIREAELPRIVQAYADDAIAALHAPTACFSKDDHDWVLKYGAGSLAEIEKATFRIAALNMTGNTHQAARLLRMSPVSLSRWLSRRMPLATSIANRNT